MHLIHNANGNNCVPYVTAIINGHRDIANFLKRNLLKNNPQAIHTLTVNDPRELEDIDTPDAWERARGAF